MPFSTYVIFWISLNSIVFSIENIYRVYPNLGEFLRWPFCLASPQQSWTTCLVYRTAKWATSQDGAIIGFMQYLISISKIGQDKNMAYPYIIPYNPI